jgi:hypothetical protein
LPAIGLGLSKWHWGMDPEQVQASYPALEWRGDAQADAELTANYRSFGCTFTITAEFFSQISPILTAVYLDTNDSQCSREVQEALLQQFGPTMQQTSPLGIVSREWRLDSNYVEFAQYPDGWLGKPERTEVTDLTNAVHISQ